MRIPKQKDARGEVLEILADLLGTDRERAQHRKAGSSGASGDAVCIDDLAFLAEYRASASAGPVASAIERLKRRAELCDGQVIPLIIVPYMGQVGRELCEKAGVSWVDLSGNAKITGPRLRIWVEGRPNKFASRGRPPNLFAPKSSRITRQLLLEPGRSHSQTGLASATGLDDGYVSKIVRRLKSDELVIEGKLGGIRPRDPDVLLDAWRSAYDFGRHRIVKGHIPARSGDALVRRIAAALERDRLDYAVTGLGAAWLLTHFASFRLATVYLSSTPPRAFLDGLEFWDEEQGANTWLVVPDDEGVFHGGRTLEGIRCVSAVQAYLDLKAHAERAREAAAELRGKCLDWMSYDG